MSQKLEKKSLLKQRADLVKQLNIIDKNIKAIDKQIKFPKFPKEIIDPLRKEFRKLEKDVVCYKMVPVKMKIVYSWFEELRVDVYQEISTWPSTKALKGLNEYKQYKKQINALNSKIQKTADKLEVDMMEIWNEVVK